MLDLDGIRDAADTVVLDEPERLRAAGTRRRARQRIAILASFASLVALAVLAVLIRPAAQSPPTATAARPSASAAAMPTPSPLPVPSPQAPTTVCTIAQDYTGAVDVTGLVAVSSGYVAIDGANNDWPPYVVHLDSSCKRTSLQHYPSSPVDPQDLAVDHTGTLWIADIGDPQVDRTHIVLWEVPPSGPVRIFRFTYPDGAHRAEAMVLDGDGRPIFITQPAGGTGPANLYEPAAGALQANATVPMTQVGSFTPQQTGTSNNLSSLGNGLVTGGANSPDGTRVALRTFSDAYEWKVTGGNVVAAITKGTPTITPLPDEQNGRSIAYSIDGRYFLIVPNVSDSAAPILQYVPATPPVPHIARPVAAGTGESTSLLNSLSLDDVRTILLVFAVLGAALLGSGIRVVYRGRAGRAHSWGQLRLRPSHRPTEDDSPGGYGGSDPHRHPGQGGRIGSAR
jgi:hypothetical protein